MMRAKHAVILAVAVLSGAVPAQVFASGGARPEVHIYEAGALTPDRYTVVKRLSVESWQSAFWVPTYEESGDAITAVEKEAAAAGANGIINLNCLNARGGWFSGKDAYYCYGNAIRVK